MSTNMGASASALSSTQYGYDVVVATTQESIDSILNIWLSGVKAETRYVCFIAVAPGTDNAVRTVTLEALLTMTGNVNPFDIPAKTPWNDPRVLALSKVNFVGGYKMQIGVPAGVTPKALSLIDLNNAADIHFSMYCKELSVVQNTLQAETTGEPAWDVWTQPVGTAWPQRASVKLAKKALDASLNIPYFENSGKDDKQALLSKLSTLKASGTTFELQQLLIDFTNGTMIEDLTFLPGG